MYNDGYYESKLKEKQDLYIIWQAMEEKFKNYPNYEEQIRKFMDDLIDMMLFDMLIVNSDREAYNWSIKYDDSTFGLVKIYDNDRSFSWSSRTALNTTQEFLPNETALAIFLEESDDSIAERAYNFFNTITPDNIREILERVIKSHDIFLEDYNIDLLIDIFTENNKTL